MKKFETGNSEMYQLPVNFVLNMSVVALYTDFPEQDFYAGMLKAGLVQQVPGVQIIDVVHGLPVGDIMRAGISLQQVWSRFPAGTIHLMAVTRLEGAYAHVAFSYNQHYFVGTDAGQFSIGLQDKVMVAKDVSHLPGGEGSFPAVALFPKLIKLIQAGSPPESWDLPDVALVGSVMPLPLDRSNPDGSAHIRGHIIYIDGYGNVLTNISKDYFEYIADGRSFIVYVRSSKYRVDRIYKRYSDVAEGNMVAVFNDSGYLEIGFTGGNLCQYLGLSVNDQVMVEFYSNKNV